MNAVGLRIAAAHLLGRRRQTLVALGGVVLGVAFFLAVSGLMRGSENDFVHRLIDNAPHVTVYDEYRAPRRSRRCCAGPRPPSSCRASSRSAKRAASAAGRASSMRCAGSPVCASPRCSAAPWC
jgi:ABC-type lipoprotein release transport system permease subunit